MKLFFRPLKYLMHRKYLFIAGIISLLVVDILQLFIPRVVKKILDDLFVNNTEMILIYFLTIVLLATGMALFRFFWRMLIVRTSFYIEEQLRNDIYQKYLNLDKKFYDQSKIGNLMSLATNDLQAVRMLFSMGVVASCDGIFLTILSMAFMFNMNSQLALFVLIPLPLISLFIIVAGKKIFTGFTRVQESFSELTAIIQEYLSGIALIKSYALESESEETIASYSKTLKDTNISLVKIWGLLFPVMVCATGIAAALTGMFGGKMALVAELSIGEFVAFFSYISILAWPMMAIGWVLNLFQRGKASIIRINAVLDSKANVVDGTVTLDSSTGFLLELDRVSFSYSRTQKPVLHEISMKIKRGDRIGITGKTGSGKTSLVNLLLRRYDPSSGKITLNGCDLTQVTLDSLYTHISCSPQDVTLFADTITNNIRMGKSDASEFEVEQAMQRASLNSTIAALPGGLETMLGERGVNLSGGQKQRVALARTFVKKADLYIFDDSLSALDTKTESYLRNAIYSLAGAVLIISHRLSTIAGCDQIYLIDEGRIIESGTHQQLLNLDGEYAAVYRKQLISGSVDNEQ